MHLSRELRSSSAGALAIATCPGTSLHVSVQFTHAQANVIPARSLHYAIGRLPCYDGIDTCTGTSQLGFSAPGVVSLLVLFVHCINVFLYFSSCVIPLEPALRCCVS
jgi:hypothetical protein